MTSAEFHQHLEILDLKQSDAAALPRVTPRAVRRWQSGEQAIPGTVAELIMVWRPTDHDPQAPPLRFRRQRVISVGRQRLLDQFNPAIDEHRHVFAKPALIPRFGVGSRPYAGTLAVNSIPSAFRSPLPRRTSGPQPGRTS